MKKQLVIHPFLFAIFPILSLLASNIGVIQTSDAIRPILISLLATTLFMFLLQLLLKSWQASGILLSVLLILFFTYGHAFVVILGTAYSLMSNFMRQIWNQSTTLILHAILLSFASLIVCGTVILLRKWKNRLAQLNLFLNLAASIAMAISLTQIISAAYKLRTLPTSDLKQDPLTHQADLADENDLPSDLYYIILDGYASSQILAELYEFDNTTFIEFLTSHGFIVTPESRSNYAQTVLSLASSLNMSYLDEILAQPNFDTSDVNSLIPIIRKSEVRDILEGFGYTTVAFSSGYGRTEIIDADIYLKPTSTGANVLESMFVDTTGMLLIEDLSSLLGITFPYPGYESHRERTLFIFEQLREISAIPGPKFVFVHFLPPHPPFVFDAEGEPIVQKHKYGLRDGSDFMGTTEEYIQGYRDQVSFMNSQVSKAISAILSSSKTTPIIILQGDHGPGAHLDWDSPENSDLEERFSILNAYLLPGVEEPILYESISPVNTFRLIFSFYFGEDYPLLPDESYFSTTHAPLEFIPAFEKEENK